MPRAKAKRSFEEQMNELESLIRELEQGDLPLEGMLQRYETGIGLIRNCRAQLQAAEAALQPAAAESSVNGADESPSKS